MNQYSDDDLKVYTLAKGPGFGALVIKNGQTEYENYFGFSSLRTPENTTPISPKTNFNIASCSKQFTAMGLLLLEQQGRVSLENHLSDFFTSIPENLKKVKISHLLYHSSGLPDYMNLNSKTKVYNSDIVDSILEKATLRFEPGLKFEYCNTGYVFLSEIIQRVTHMPFPDFIREEIFKPLGMTQSFVTCDQNEVDGSLSKAIGYNEWPFLTESDASPYNYNFGDGGIYTSLHGYKKWAAFLEAPEMLLTPTSHRKYFEEGLSDHGEKLGYAYGWGLSEFNDKKLYFHYGAWLGFKSYTGYIPEQKLWVVIFSNYRGMLIENVSQFFLKKYGQNK